MSKRPGDQIYEAIPDEIDNKVELVSFISGAFLATFDDRLDHPDGERMSNGEAIDTILDLFDRLTLTPDQQARLTKYLASGGKDPDEEDDE